MNNERAYVMFSTAIDALGQNEKLREGKRDG